MSNSTGRQCAGSSKISSRVPPRPEIQEFPDFWMNAPEAWFRVAESHFFLLGITDQNTKYRHAISIMANLPRKDLLKIKDVVQQKPTENQYDGLKSKLIAHLKAPSQLLHQLQQQASRPVSPNEILLVWLSALPPELSALLLPHIELPIIQLCAVADTLGKALDTVPKHAALADEGIIQKLEELEKRMEALELSVNNKLGASSNRARSTHRRRSRSSSRGRVFRHSSSALRPLNKSGICYYHEAHGTKAKHCSPGCKWSMDWRKGSY